MEDEEEEEEEEDAAGAEEEVEKVATALFPVAYDGIQSQNISARLAETQRRRRRRRRQ